MIHTEAEAYRSHCAFWQAEVQEECEDEAQEGRKKSHSDQREVLGDQDPCHEAEERRTAESKEAHQDSKALAEAGVLCNHHSLLEDEEEQHSLDSLWEASEGVCSREVEDSRSHSLYHEEAVVGNGHSLLGRDLLGEDSQQHRGQGKADARDHCVQS